MQRPQSVYADPRRGMSLTYPDHHFWHRKPLAATSNINLYTIGPQDNLSIECAKIFVAERSRREKIVKEETAERVCQIKHVVYELHLDRTERITRGELAPEVVQAREPDSTIVLEVLIAEEQRERAAIDQYEYDAGQRLFEHMWPALIKAAKAIATAREAIMRKEQNRRFRLVQEWEHAHQVLTFRRSILRHTEQVVTQMNREDNRVCAINEKLDRLAYRSLVRDTFDVQVPHTPTEAAGTPVYRGVPGGVDGYCFPDAAGDCGLPVVALPGLPQGGASTPTQSTATAPSAAAPHSHRGAVGAVIAAAAAYSPDDRLVELHTDVEFLETHITGLRALRQIEEEKLRVAQVELRRIEDRGVAEHQVLRRYAE